MFPKEGAKMSKDAKDFLERLKKLRGTITDLDDQINKEFEKYSGDVRYFAEYQTGLQDFYPRLVEAEERITDELVNGEPVLRNCLRRSSENQILPPLLVHCFCSCPPMW